VRRALRHAELALGIGYPALTLHARAMSSQPFNAPLTDADPDPFMDWTSARAPRLAYSYAHFADAKVFVFRKWCERAQEQQRSQPFDLSGACKYGSLFMQSVFGGGLRGHFEHQFNLIDGRLVDLSHDAMDVGRMRHPYLHEHDYFAVPALQRSLAECLPRAEGWASEFLLGGSPA
jgi:hypothetical protein